MGKGETGEEKILVLRMEEKAENGLEWRENRRTMLTYEKESGG